MKSFEELLKDELKSAKYVLNLGAGKWDYSWAAEIEGLTFVVNVDRSYGSMGVEHPADVLLQHRSMEEKSYEYETDEDTRIVKFVTSDIFEFAESYPLKFDLIIAARIFEHQYHDDGSIGRLMYACYSLLKSGGVLLILVPNHLRLCESVFHVERLLEAGVSGELGKDFRGLSILMNIVNTEIYSTKADPHGSLWTPELAKLYVQLVDGLEIEKVEDVNWEGRKCYMALTLKKCDGTREEKN